MHAILYGTFAILFTGRLLFSAYSRIHKQSLLHKLTKLMATEERRVRAGTGQPSVVSSDDFPPLFNCARCVNCLNFQLAWDISDEI